MPYRLNLASGRTIDLFFYDGPVSRAVAFEGLLANGEGFAKRLLESYTEGQNRGELINIAVRVGQHLIAVNRFAGGPPHAPGDKVTLGWRADDAIVIPDVRP